MTTQQPTWKCIGHVGNVDPIAYGGGFVYMDETDVYAPEMTWFEPGTDEQWHETGGSTPLQVYRFVLERESRKEWWFDRLQEIASYTGRTLEECQLDAVCTNPLVLANLYSDLVRYYGAEEFDSYPSTITEDEAYARFTEEMKIRR